MIGHSIRHKLPATTYKEAIAQVCDLNWRALTRDELINVAWTYYYFSIQFRENLEIACELYPNDAQLRQLDQGERNTDNLSPWPGIVEVGEKINHDEFMRRTLDLIEIPEARRRHLDAIGQAYLAIVRGTSKTSRALSIASYEDGGLQSVFQSILQAENWDGPILQSFKHFLTEHIRFDSDPEQGHGALCRHLRPDDRVLSFWNAFRRMLVEAAPALTKSREASIRRELQIPNVA
ncbi:MAG TPA: hypothetical protein VG271_16215 [Beijerinckiaceae bacterium]|nr:hypothetical protein [Beijerinckiaceae bacterium]